MRPTVTIIQECIPQYRLPFFEGLRDSLERDGVALRLLVGHASGSYAKRMDTVELPWGTSVPQWNMSWRGHDLVWQHPWHYLEGSDLIIVPAQIRQIASTLIWLLQQVGLYRVAYYGHGRDFAKSPETSTERLKRSLSRRVHWWFAYNKLSSRTIEDFGFPPERITSVDNSTDTKLLIYYRNQIRKEDLIAMRATLGLGEGPVAIYVGAMARIKQLHYLIEACDSVRKVHPTFNLLMVGTGPDEAIYKNECENRPWIHWIGPAFGRKKVELMLLADINLLPAWVGLGIVDSFALEVPTITTDAFLHSVEIDYLEHGANGWMVSGHPDAKTFGNEVATILSQPELLTNLRNGCKQSGTRYSIEQMVLNFKNGILSALEAPSIR